MKTISKILIIIVFCLCTSISPDNRKLPEKIDLNEYFIWNTKRDVIQLKDGWLTLTFHQRDSLDKDAYIKITEIKRQFSKNKTYVKLR